MNYIELFAGCGGLSIGMESEGFNLTLANEISPMASETFAYNLLSEDLNNTDNISHTFWLKSKYPTGDTRRLREDYRFSDTDKLYSDVSKITNYTKLNKSLLVGSIVDLNSALSDSPKLCEEIRNSFGNGRVDLISGGSPCQSFSMAGLRDHSSEKNKLPWEFAEFVEKVKPRMVLLENVTGILRAFKVNNKSHYAWFEVAKAFASIGEGYIPICLHINAKYVGVAQNRPRFIMMAFEQSLAKKIILDENLGEFGKQAFKKAIKFTNLVQENIEPEYDPNFYYDLNNSHPLFNEAPFNILSKNPITNETTVSTVEDAIHDLKNPMRITTHSKYVEQTNSLSSSMNSLFTYSKNKKPPNHEPRANSEKVKARFHLYQIMSRVSDNEISNNLKCFLRNPTDNSLSDKAFKLLRSKKLYSFDGTYCSFNSKSSLEAFLTSLQTKKQTQRALIANKPAPAALSIPDDACHYFPKLLRTLTVREMARIQSFPDQFEFRSKITTGGKMRRFEVPQYTQVGNAVPPLLGKALGKLCKHFLVIS